MTIQKDINIDISDYYGNIENIPVTLNLHLKKEEILIVLDKEEGEHIFLNNINNFAGFLKKVPDKIIKEMTEKSYKVMIDFFENWIKKIKEVRNI